LQISGRMLPMNWLLWFKFWNLWCEILNLVLWNRGYDCAIGLFVIVGTEKSEGIGICCFDSISW
jgi:hypothetical protein